jgi:DNA-directed RNA polymerase specialized sigma subunit
VRNSKEFLSKAYLIDKRITGKIEQILRLRELAMKANSVLSDMPPNTTRNFRKMEEAIIKMVDLENEISEDINYLVDLKQKIVKAIKKVGDPEYQTLLELRYLCFKTWSQIAVDLHYGIDNVFKIHKKALKTVNYLQE